DQHFNPLVLISGNWPAGPHDIAIDSKTANGKHYAVGQSIGVLTSHGPVQQFHIVGLVRFGGLNSLGGATLAIFDLPTAQRIFDKVGKLDSIGIASKQNVTPDQLVAQVKPLLP